MYLYLEIPYDEVKDTNTLSPFTNTYFRIENVLKRREVYGDKLDVATYLRFYRIESIKANRLDLGPEGYHIKLGCKLFIFTDTVPVKTIGKQWTPI